MRRTVILLMGLVCSVPLIASCGCDSLQQAVYKAGIEKALHEDALTGTEPTVGHTNAMRNVDMATCPPEFRVAYIKHIHAWEEKTAVHDAKLKLDADDDSAAAAGALATIFGSDETPWSDHIRAKQELQKYEAVASSDVESTWREVEEIAGKYDVKVSH